MYTPGFLDEFLILFVLFTSHQFTHLDHIASISSFAAPVLLATTVLVVFHMPLFPFQQLIWWLFSENFPDTEYPSLSMVVTLVYSIRRVGVYELYSSRKTSLFRSLKCLAMIPHL